MMLASEIPGRLIMINIDDGVSVKKNDIVALLDNRDCR